MSGLEQLLRIALAQNVAERRLQQLDLNSQLEAFAACGRANGRFHLFIASISRYLHIVSISITHLDIGSVGQRFALWKVTTIACMQGR